MPGMWEQIDAALNDAEAIDRATRHHSERMARLLVGRLRTSRIPGSLLAELKRELRDYNIHTNTWGEQ